jgi:hypothetical protein
MWHDLLDLLQTVMLPAFLTSLLLALLCIRLQRAGLAVLGGLLVANYFSGLVPWTMLPWREQDWGWPIILWACALGSLVLDSLGALRLEQRGWRLLAAIWIGLLSYVLMYPDLASMWLKLLVAIAASEAFLLLLAAEQRLPRWYLVTGWSLSCMVAAGVIYYAHSVRLAEMSLMLGASLAGVAVALRWTSGKVTTLYGLVILFLPPVIFAGDFETYSQLPPAAFFLLLIGPLSAGLVLLPSFQDKQRVGFWIVTVIWIGCMAVALGLAMIYETPYLF